ncbi:hypothetical protein [Sinorhizobium americanum]|uniref:Uncharacterized protein n=1 Tax=Sinorhizobium americanum TaxID=194963 RepID=A0A1L3LTC9_9HYPH|nr:hypothetical protein [Sinorhizobium americanum]APG93332.1 hypothetical protein SAMCFNEI73_pB0132 [Sinorhizobium americanum]OAP38652.1 hypothetical protein ATC00_12160 [Sinorhizobium americanum]
MVRSNAVEDPLCYLGSHVLRNKADIKDQLDEFEQLMFDSRAEEALPEGDFARCTGTLFRTFMWLREGPKAAVDARQPRTPDIPGLFMFDELLNIRLRDTARRNMHSGGRAPVLLPPEISSNPNTLSRSVGRSS